jgi:hypothetical protein
MVIPTVMGRNTTRRVRAVRIGSSPLKVLEIKVRFLRPDLAVLHWTWSIQGDGLEDPVTHEPRKGIFTMIA